MGCVLWLIATSAASGAQCGIASWYGYTGNRTANGEVYTGAGMTCAHRTAPFGTRYRVEDMRTGVAIICRVNDRGPFIRGRIIDLSREAATWLSVRHAGLVRVCITALKTHGQRR